MEPLMAMTTTICHHTYRPSTYPTCETDNGHQKLSNLDYSLEENRLQTLVNWSNEAVLPQDLAHAGFYRPSNSASEVVSDLVKCYACSAEICNWERGDVPLEEHRKWSPVCEHVRKLAGNTGEDVCGNMEMYRNSIPERETFRLLSNMMNGYDDLKIRLETFTNWPATAVKTPQELADAGFYYTGRDDHTICFVCGNALKEWKEEDDPWEEHARWFPNCHFVLDKKGAEFVESVKRKYQEQVPCETKETVNVNTAKPTTDGVLACQICDSNERSVIFRPCNHILACEKCASKFSDCPVCRQNITGTMRVYLS